MEKQQNCLNARSFDDSGWADGRMERGGKGSVEIFDFTSVIYRDSKSAFLSVKVVKRQGTPKMGIKEQKDLNVDWSA